MNSERKEYQKNYRKTYLKKKVRKEIIFSFDEFKAIKQKSLENKTNISAFIKETVLNSLTGSYFFPHKQTLHKLQLLILQIGNNINQIAKHTNSVRTCGIFKAQKIWNNLNLLESKIEKFVTGNSDFLLTLTDKTENDPKFIYEIECILYKQKLKYYDCKNNQMEK